MAATWFPDQGWRGRSGAAVALADAIERDVLSSRLLPGDDLPTHRNLARMLGVSVGTVTRGYELARTRGLIRGEVGRGTVITERARFPGIGPLALLPDGDATVDLAHNIVSTPLDATLRDRIAEAWRTVSYHELSQRVGPAGTDRDREAGASWVGVRDAAEVVIANGGQHGIVTALMASCRPGDVVACDALVYPGVRAAASILSLQLIPVTSDSEGMSARSLRQVLRESAAKVLWVTPTVHNPTAEIMSESRRVEIASICSRSGVTVIEDDAYRFCAPDAPPPIADRLGDRGIRISSLAKSTLPGLRVAYISSTPLTCARLATTVGHNSWMVSPATARVATALIERGTAAAVAAERHQDLSERSLLARTILGALVSSHAAETSIHAWIPTESHARDAAIQAALREQGISVLAAREFSASDSARTSSGLRISLGAVPISGLTSALARVRDVVVSTGDPRTSSTAE